MIFFSDRVAVCNIFKVMQFYALQIFLKTVFINRFLLRMIFSVFCILCVEYSVFCMYCVQYSEFCKFCILCVLYSEFCKFCTLYLKFPPINPLKPLKPEKIHQRQNLGFFLHYNYSDSMMGQNQMSQWIERSRQDRVRQMDSQIDRS